VTGEPHVLLLGLGVSGPGGGGLERYFDALFRGLGPRASGVVVGPRGSGPIGVVAVSDSAAPLVSRVVAYARAARATGAADVVDVHFPLYGAFPVLFGGRRRTPLVVHFHGPWADEARTNGGDGRVGFAVRRVVERRLYRRADAIVTLSGAFARLLVERYGVSPWVISVVAPGVDRDRWQGADRVAARARLGIPDSAWVVACVRRLVRRTGVDVLVDAWSAVGDDADALVVVAGDGPELEHLSAAAARNGLAGRVRFLGHVTDAELVDVYAAADVSVVPSRAWEGFGLVVLESLAAGTPVIVTDEGGLPEAVVGLGHDLVVRRDDVGALAARLKGARCGLDPLPEPDACRAHAESFDWADVVRTHCALYERVADRRPDERLRVLYLDHCAQRSGGEIALVRTLGALRGVDAHVLLFEPGPIEPLLGQIGVTAEVLPLTAAARTLSRDRLQLSFGAVRAAAGTAWFTLRLARRIRQLRPDLVHANSTKAAITGSVASRLVGRPFIWHQRELLADTRMSPTARRLVRALAARAPTAIVANSDATLATMGTTRRRRHTVPTFVVPDCAPLPELATRPFVGDPVCFGVVGRLAPQKGQREFLMAFARGYAGDPAVTARIVGAPLFGEDAYARELRDLTDSLGLGGQVTFVGHRDDVVGELARMDVAVVPSVVPEGFGLSLLEAMGAGLPVIATVPGGPSEIVTDGTDGLLVPCGDVTALAAAMLRLVVDTDLRRRLGAAARTRAADFVPARSAERLADVYRRVLDRPLGQ